MNKILALALLVCWLLMGGSTLVLADTADQVDSHSNTVVEGLVVGISDVSSGTAAEVDSTGYIYTRPKPSVVGYATGNGRQVYTGACQITGASFVVLTADEYVEIYDGTSRGSFTTCLADLTDHVAYTTVFWKPEAPVTISTGIYAYKSDAGSIAYIEYR